MRTLFRIFIFSLIVWGLLLWALLGKAALRPLLDIQMHNTYFVLHNYWGQLILFLAVCALVAFMAALQHFTRKIRRRYP